MVLVAKTNALIEYDGRRIVIKGGITTAHEDHPIVREHPEIFEPQKIHFSTEQTEVKEPVSAPIESATAAPGERRTVTTSSAPSRRGRRAPKGGSDE